MAMSKSKNYHNWYGLLSTYTTKFGENFDFYGGVDFRYYKGVHTNELVDLYGGEYYIDSSSRANVLPAYNKAAAAGDAFVNQKLKVGDVVYRDYDGFTMSEGVFGQLEYNQDKLSAFASGAVSNTKQIALTQGRALICRFFNLHGRDDGVMVGIACILIGVIILRQREEIATVKGRHVRRQMDDAEAVSPYLRPDTGCLSVGSGVHGHNINIFLRQRLGIYTNNPLRLLA